jgi:hypothetical protein
MSEFNKLKKKNGEYQMVIIDEEGDDIKLSFHYDNCVNIDTEGYSYLTLNLGNLYRMIEAIEQAEEKYFNEYTEKLNQNQKIK